LIALDTNLLVYAFRPDVHRHDEANEALRGLLEGSRAWALPWSVVHEFIAVVTQPRIWREPATTSQALAAIDGWLRAPGARLLAEGPAYREHLDTILAGDDVRGGRVFDARIAATCLSHGVDELWSADRDLSRFPMLRVRNPLV
jgi:toxin-antitoxin system PIN domain toxin